MALKADASAKLKTLGFDVDKLIAAIKADAETDVVIPEGTLITEADLTTRDTNKLNEGKKLGETEGERKGKELAAKAFRKKFGLEDTVGNDVDKVVEAVNSKVNKGDAGLQEQITLLQKDKETLTASLTTEQAKAKDAIFAATLISSFPAKRTSVLKDNEMLTLLRQDLIFEEHEGKQVVKRNGEIIRDKTTQNPVPVGQAITDYFNERKWIDTGTGGTGGRGGGDNGGTGGSGSGIKTMSQAQAEWIKANPSGNVMSDEFVSYVGKIAKANPDFKAYE
ncbi:MAG: hypothetical protein Q8941_20490 [Bacteroidota bacterium]|nr:hypothetical protein [Bacteroidota bacterium]